jgi:endonuclease/exonuclease/phosphatase family metal-dependent hydrolase
MQFLPKKPAFSLRAMTYNIHSCVGTDRKLNPERVAGVIDEAAPDIVALQEVDNGIPRTQYQDQSQLLAEMLDMEAVFFPVVRNGPEKYGLAVLSRLKCIDVHFDWLPTLYPRLKLDLQKRGCLRTTLQTPVGPVLFFNTHLSIYRLERRGQIRALTGNDWLEALAPDSAIIFCGDLNATPLSPVYRRLQQLLSDVQKSWRNPAKPKATFPSYSPLLRIDHLFVSNCLEVLGVQVPRTPDTRLASDHLPLVADLEFTPNKPDVRNSHPG